MKERQKMMLRFMLINEKSLLIDDLADEFSIGRRTVSRDLDALDRWLSLRGSRLERKQNQGIKVLGFSNSPEELLTLINKPESYLETLSPNIRKKHILLYLLYNNREIKITDIAQTFYISDTSVWNDLNIIETEIAGQHLELLRLKGVGIKLLGDETSIRLKFITTLSEIFSAGAIVPYLYSIREDSQVSLEVNQFKLLMKRLNFPESNPIIHNLIQIISDKLGYRFTMSGEALLYFYLQLTFHRIKSEALISDSVGFTTLKQLDSISKSLLEELVSPIFSGEITRGEIKVLAQLLQVLEIGDITSVKTEIHKEIISKEIKKLTKDMIKEFSKIDNRLYYMNEHIESVISLALASLITRLTYNIPYWHGEWGNSSSEDWGREAKERVLSDLIQTNYNLIPQKGDLQNILLHFYSLVLNVKDLPRRRVRCLVCCFEGIGLASYLQSILQREVYSIKVIEATAVYKIQQEYLDKQNIELVISTFSLNHLTTPVIPISLPFNKSKLKQDIATAVIKIHEIEKEKPQPTVLIENKESIEFEDILNFIKNFDFFEFSDVKKHSDIIDMLSSKLSDNEQNNLELSVSLKKREDLGPLYFEEYGMRVLHCKSGTVDRPRAGVISFNDTNRPRLIFMVAPSPCPDNIRKMLSVITISFLENRVFRNSIIKGDLKLIRKNLMDIYKDLI